ncbi:TrkA C-terminal domain-containing protein [bacterium]|nr:TrkA C-terminal domain-containing protein [bacterium]
MGLFFLIITIALIFLIWEIASVALSITGLAHDKARFQALSALTGTGFTTRDSELIVSHRQRRAIVMALMILGNIGIILILSNIIVSKTTVYLFVKLGIFSALLFFLYKISSHKGLMRKLKGKIEDRLLKSSVFEKRAIEEILNLAQGYGVVELNLKENFPYIGRTLAESPLREKDILVLTINRDNITIPAPKGQMKMQIGDTLICYGKLAGIKELVSQQKSKGEAKVG